MSTQLPSTAAGLSPAALHVRARIERLVPVGLMITVLVAAILTITPWPVGAFEDDAIYTVLAKALATGDGYRMINLPGSPHATHFPPGYPFLLSLLWRLWPVFPDNVVVFKFANAALLAIGAGGLYWFARARLGWNALGAAAVAAVGTASVTMLNMSGLVLSEPLYVALLFVALLVVERCADDGNIGTALLAGALLGALSMVRTIGAVAIGAAIVVLLLRRHPRAAVAVAAMSALFLVPWQLWVGAYQGEIAPILTGKYGAYGSWLVDGYREGGVSFARDVVNANLAGAGNSLSYALMPVPYRWPRILSLVLLVPMVIGGLVVLAKRAPVFVAFFVLYVGVILAWPFDPHRFLVALWPMLVVVVAAAGRSLWHRRPVGVVPQAARFAALGGLAFLVAGHALYNWRGYSEQSWADLPRRAAESAKPLVEWVAQATRTEDVLSTEHDVVVYLYTGRRSVPTSTFLARQYVAPFAPDEVVRWVESMVTTFQPRYFITSWPERVTAAEALAARTPPGLRRLGSIADHVVYEPVVR